MSSDKYLNKLVIARTMQGDIQFVGRCVSYCDAPTISVNTPNGGQSHWRADLCEVVEIDPKALDLLLQWTDIQPAPESEKER